MRFILGPLCDKYGARVLFAVILCTASIPTAFTGLVNSITGLVFLRLCIGIAGGTFVMCQCKYLATFLVFAVSLSHLQTGPVECSPIVLLGQPMLWWVDGATWEEVRVPYMSEELQPSHLCCLLR